MANLYLDRHPLKDGRRNIYISVCKDGRTFLLGTGVRCTPEEWDPAKCEIIGAPASVNVSLHRQVLEIEQKISELKIAGKYHGLTPAALKEALLPKVKSADFYACAVEKMKTREGSTRESYKHLISRLSRFHAAPLQFSTITPGFLERFSVYLEREGLKVNTRHALLKNLRAVLNYAIGEGITDVYPFRRFHLKKEPTAKRALTLDQLHAFLDKPLQNAKQEYARDMFLASLLLCGMNMKDLYKLPKQEGKEISFRRTKTGNLITLPLLPEVEELMEKHAGRNTAFDISDKYKDEDTACSCMTKELKKIRRGITMYWARHTWATIAASLDIPMETIAAALGHSSESVTAIYIRFDNTKITRAARRVADMALYGMELE